jgi:hypothetical protein
LGPFLFWVFAIEDFASHSVYLKPIVASFEGKRKRKRKRTRLFSVLFLTHFGFEGVDILRGRFFFFSSGFSWFRMCPCACWEY